MERISDERLDQIVSGDGDFKQEAMQMAVELQQRRDAERAPLSFPPENELYEPGRCQVCGWLIRKRMGGCTAESCTYRPRERSSEWFRIKKRREWLAASAKEGK